MRGVRCYELDVSLPVPLVVVGWGGEEGDKLCALVGETMNTLQLGLASQNRL